MTRIKPVAIIIAALAICLSSQTAASAQVKDRFENYIKIGLGPAMETQNYENAVGTMQSIGYGLDIKLTDKFSIMPEIATRSFIEEPWHIGMVGGNPDFFNFVDLYIRPRYKVDIDGSPCIVSLAPVISYADERDSYYIDADPNDPLGGKTKIKKMDYALAPAVGFQKGNHWEFSLQAYISMRDIMIQYPQYNHTGTKRLSSLMAEVAFHF